MYLNKNYNLLIIKLIAIIICGTYSYQANAQIFDSEQNSPGLKWKQINTKNFQIIYPTTFEDEAQRMANTLQSIILDVSKSLHKEPRKISIILQNQSTSSNGFVQLAPRRSEFYTTPPQDFDYQDWLNSLAVHELRHVVQFDKLTGNLKAPIFEELALAIFGITLPPWFYEGDAVGIETALTNSGRGRLPSWDIILRTNTLSGKKYSYSKDYFGSAKNPTPGFYQLGFFMTTKLRRDYGTNIIDSIFTKIASNPFRPYSFNSSLRKFTGLNTNRLHNKTLKELGQLWQEQSDKLKPTSYQSINKRRNIIPADYYLPIPITSSETLVLKHSKAETPSFTIIDTLGNEKKLYRIGIQENPHFSYSSGKIVWDELRFDPRYQKRSYNVINSYDIASKTYRQLTHHSRLFSPTLSPDGKTIAAIDVSFGNIITVVELNAETGIEVRKYPNPSNLILQTPKYNTSGSKLVLVGVNTLGETICEIDRNAGTFKALIPFQLQQIARPTYQDNDILFSAHYNGLNNIYRLNTATSVISQLTSSMYGAFNPTYDEQSKLLYFNNYQVNGQDIASISLENVTEIPLNKLTNTFIDYAKPLVVQEGNKNVFENIPTEKFEAKPYRELNNLFYFHSVGLVMETNESTDNLNFGLKLLSTNKLNTLDFYTGYQYNNGLKRSEYFAGFTYKRFYPILDVKYINRGRLDYEKQLTAGITTFSPIYWRENFTELAVTVPLVFNQHNYLYSMGIKAATNYASRYNIENKPVNFIEKIRFPMTYQLYLNRNTRRSFRDIAPSWGQNFNFSYQYFPFEKQLKGDRLSFRSIFYTPGLMQNHSFQVRFNYQRNSGNYNLSKDIPEVSGYTHFTRTNPLSNTLLLKYQFPLSYPDFELGPLAYIKRIRGGVFTDFENIKNDMPFAPKTYGLELTADMNLLRFYLPNFAIGGKLIILNEKPTQRPIFELGFNYNY